MNHDLTQPLEFCDESGRVLGWYTPTALALTGYEPWEPLISEEELRRREPSNNWYSTDQVLDCLQNLEK